MKTVWVGAFLVVLYTGLMTAVDGITKFIAGGYEAPQLFALASFFVVAMSLAMAKFSGDGVATGLRIVSVKTMALRSVLTVVASVCFFQAFAALQLADVFLFVGLIPLISASLSGPFLNERPRPLAWVALTVGLGGIIFLLPGGVSGISLGHIWAFAAALSGAGSMMAARAIARVERVPLAQVLWPNLALMLSMAVALPFVWKEISLADLGFILIYAIALFAARYVVVEALRLLPTYVATPLMNLQFVWMVIVGLVFFNETPTLGTILGAMLVIASGLWLVVEEGLANRQQRPKHKGAVPAE